MNEDNSELLARIGEARASGEIGEQEASDAESVLSRSDSVEVPSELVGEGGTAEPAKESEDLRAKLKDMTLPQKIKLAMFGNATARSLLIGDANRIVQECVLKNPQLRDGEVCDFAKNPNLSEYVLRYIANNKTWMKLYATKLNLVTNPKCPTDVSMKWLRHMRKLDLRKISKSKNIPQVIATTAKKRLAEMKG